MHPEDDHPLTVMKRYLYSRLPTAMRIQGWRNYLWNSGRDALDIALRKRDPRTPPYRLNISGGGGDFLRLGEHNLMLCKTLAGLQANEAMLDLGCGIGRTARAAQKFIDAGGSYTGMDVIPFAVDWCEKHIGSEQPNFRFVHADVQNASYNPGGRWQAREFVFPFAAAAFDFCLATSLFTHLLPDATQQYLRETARVLRPGGRFVSTWFLLDEITTALLAAGRSEYQFPHVFATHAQKSSHAPEQAVAYFLPQLKEWFEQAGFDIDGVHHGGWSGATDSIDSGQDVVVAHVK